jgi:ribosomal protein L35
MANKVKIKTRSVLKGRLFTSSTGKMRIASSGKRHAMYKRCMRRLHQRKGTHEITKTRVLRNLIQGCSL